MNLAVPALSSKSPEAFRTISEASSELDVPQHVLRFWESRFHQVRPLKRAGGRRFYRPEDVDLLRGIRTLLYHDGYTIKGVQKVLREKGARHVAEIGRNDAAMMREARAFPRDVEAFGPADAIEESPIEAIATLARVHAEAADTLASTREARLTQLLGEFLNLKIRLRAARARVA